jgi:hypothetical protein
MTLFLLLNWACSKEELETPPSSSPPPFVPRVDCRIESWVNTTGNGFSFEFDYEDARLAGMIMTARSLQWPMQYDFHYTGEQLTGITLTPGNDSPDYDSLVTRIKYDYEDRPAKFVTIEYLNGNQNGELVKEIAYDDHRFLIRQLKPVFGPYDVFFQDNGDNIERLENYDINGAPIKVEISEFDDRPSPFKDFPLAFKLHFHVQIGPSWGNNVTRSFCESIAERESTLEEFEYSYNREGYPSISRNINGAQVYQMNYQNCE